jgi:hypothetical protein
VLPSRNGILGLSALSWPLAPALALVGLTGFLEGPAYSGSIAVRQRHTPPAIRAQLQTTISGIALVAASVGAAIGGLFHHLVALVFAFTAINALAALSAAGGGLAADAR